MAPCASATRPPNPNPNSNPNPNPNSNPNPNLCRCHTASAEELRRDDRGGDDEVPTRGFKMTCTPTDPTSQISVDWCEATCGENPAGCDPALCECKQQPARSALAA